MFDIGFFELMVIGVLALLVLGPERLPKAARTAGLWIGRIKQSVSSIQQEVNQQLHLEEMQRQLEENRRKLEDTLRQQEQSITEAKPANANTSTVDLNATDMTPTSDHSGTTGYSDVASAMDSATVSDKRDSVQDEGPFGTTPPERKG